MALTNSWNWETGNKQEKTSLRLQSIYTRVPAYIVCNNVYLLSLLPWPSCIQTSTPSLSVTQDPRIRTWTLTKSLNRCDRKPVPVLLRHELQLCQVDGEQKPGQQRRHRVHRVASLAGNYILEGCILWGCLANAWAFMLSTWKGADNSTPAGKVDK